jgi:DNA replication ATP-dependent helicase Dna2
LTRNKQKPQSNTRDWFKTLDRDPTPKKEPKKWSHLTPNITHTQVEDPVVELLSLLNTSLKNVVFRGLVIDITRSDALILSIINSADEKCTLILNGQWSNSNVEIGLYIHLVSLNNNCSQIDTETIVLDDTSPLVLIVDPDRLISCTSVSDSCIRRSFLSEKVKSSTKSKALIVGTIAHSIIQECLAHGNFSELFISSTIKDLIKQHRHDLYVISCSENDILKELDEMIPRIKDFQLNYLARTFNVERGTSLKVHGIMDIEETIWSPAFGLKGNVDVTLDVQIDNSSRVLVPLEIKSGKSTSGNMSHRAQTALYVYLLTQKYGIQAS